MEKNVSELKERMNDMWGDLDDMLDNLYQAQKDYPQYKESLDDVARAIDEVINAIAFGIADELDKKEE